MKAFSPWKVKFTLRRWWQVSRKDFGIFLPEEVLKMRIAPYVQYTIMLGFLIVTNDTEHTEVIFFH